MSVGARRALAQVNSLVALSRKYGGSDVEALGLLLGAVVQLALSRRRPRPALAAVISALSHVGAAVPMENPS